MTEVRMRFRTDSSLKAEDLARHFAGKKPRFWMLEALRGVESAQPGDVWRVHWNTPT